MGFKFKPTLLKCDFIGLTPQLRILNENSYKSIFSAILSVLLIIFSIIFLLYSFVEYVNQNPNVEYYKNNDNLTNKTVILSDTLLMFQYFFFCYGFKREYPLEVTSIDNNRETITKLELEPCELGKNINLKYKELVEKFEKTEPLKINEFCCINFNNTNLTIFDEPSKSHDLGNYLHVELASQCTDNSMFITIVTQNDIIDHSKKNPFVPNYQINNIYLQNMTNTYLVYNYQYIKYESDDGIIFSNKIISNGIGYGGSNPFDRIDYSSSIFTIDFKINSANYDFYRRSFIKFQSFLADVMSLINLLITISKIVSEFLLYKKMHKDIIRNILTMNEKENYIKRRNIISKNHKLDNIYDSDKVTKKEKYEKKIIENKILEDENSKNAIQLKNDVFVIENEIFDKKIINVMKNLNIINIMKSFFCYKERKLKLINLCNDIVYKIFVSKEY